MSALSRTVPNSLLKSQKLILINSKPCQTQHLKQAFGESKLADKKLKELKGKTQTPAKTKKQKTRVPASI